MEIDIGIHPQETPMQRHQGSVKSTLQWWVITVKKREKHNYAAAVSGSDTSASIYIYMRSNMRQ